MDLDVAIENSAAIKDDIDAILRRDPMGTYALMDQRSRSDYQNQVRMWAERSGRCADGVARLAIELAAQACHRYGTEDRRAHVGYFLTENGLADLAAALGAKLSLQERLRRPSSRGPLLVYCAVTLSLCAMYGVISVWLFDIHLPWFGQALLALATALYVSCIIPGWLNMFLSRLLVPRLMPRLDFSAGIPASAQTLVVIPCLLTSREGIRKLAHALEKLRQNNPDAGAGYAMLSDFVDATTQHASGDAGLLEEACSQIDALNERHGGGFVLLHRARRWNPGESIWMGWERKRGKLEELNSYLVNGVSPFEIMHGDVAKVVGTRYVLTLDDDNAALTPGAVHGLAGALAHPLNRATLNKEGTRVEAGFVILQPRGMISLPDDSAPSRLETLFHSTIEIETSKAFHLEQPTVDVDQEVFGQAVYVGKGIYDVELFHRLTHGLIAENTILSHDVLEGGLVRAGVVTDIVLHETFVPTFYAAARRTHRWQRGDWQLIPWLFPTVRNDSGVHVRNPLSLFGRWKIFHNVMRMLFPIASLACFVVGWAASTVPGLWTVNLLAVAWIPAIVALMLGVARNLLAGSFKTMLRGLWSSLSMRSANFIFSVEYAQSAFDAAARSSYRMLISHRRLLEWTASIVVSTRHAPTLAQYIRMMWLSPIFAIATVYLISRVNPLALPSAAPFAVLWMSAPFVAWWWSQKPPGRACSAQSAQP